MSDLFIHSKLKGNKVPKITHLVTIYRNNMKTLTKA